MSEPFDETAKTFLHRLFSSWGMKVETEREVFARARTIDLVVDCVRDDRQRLAQTPFSHFRQQNGIELKGNRDPLTDKDYNRSLMRIWALGGIDKPKGKKAKKVVRIVRNPAKRTLTMICVTRPTKILSMPDMKFMATDQPGFYLHDGQLPIWIIHPSELELIERNYPLLPLAKGQKLEQFIELCVREGLTDYLQLILDIGLSTDPDAILRKIMEVTQMPVKIREDTWSYINSFLKEVPEGFKELSSFRDVLQEKERVAWREGEQIGAQRAQQRMLVRQLRRKFPQAPEAVVQRIEATESIEVLDRWLDEIIMANDLADTELGRASLPA